MYKILVFNKGKCLCHLHKKAGSKFSAVQHTCLCQQNRRGRDCCKCYVSVDSAAQKLNQPIIIKCGKRIDRTRKNNAFVVCDVYICNCLCRHYPQTLFAAILPVFTCDKIDFFFKPYRQSRSQAGNFLQGKIRI